MATQTPNYKLIKQGQEDYYNVDILNGNMDLIDTALKEQGEAIGEVSSQLAQKANKSKIHIITLPASGWTGSAAPYANQVSVDDVTANNNIEVALAASVTATQYAAGVDAQLHCTAQRVGAITVSAYDTKPTVDIPITVAIWG
jgi:ABC-type molybdenum transport system ATPase subunit/photorepair protein PhrA